MERDVQLEGDKRGEEREDDEIGIQMQRENRVMADDEREMKVKPAG